MVKRQKKQPPGVPQWVMTFGDLMSLLLVFFVLIVSFSEIIEEERYEATVEQIQESFGFKGGGGRLPTDTDPRLTFLDLQENLQRQQHRHPDRAETDHPGMDGHEREVTKVREGMQYTIGGQIMFEPASADLTEEARRQLRRLVERQERIRGTNNLLELHGHAASMELAGDRAHAFDDLWSLSHARARAVFEYLTQEIGLKPERFRLIANADREPLLPRDYDVTQQAANRRVSIVFSESLIQHHTGSSD